MNRFEDWTGISDESCWRGRGITGRERPYCALRTMSARPWDFLERWWWRMAGSSRTALRESWLDRRLLAIEHCWRRKRVCGKDLGRAATGVTCGWKMAAWQKSCNGPRCETRYERRSALAFLVTVRAGVWARSSGAQKRAAAI